MRCAVPLLALMLAAALSAVAAPVSLFRDLPLAHGFRLSAVRSSMRPVEVGTVLSNDSGAEPQWRLAQWGTRFSLEGAGPESTSAGVRVLVNKGKTVKVFPGGLAGEGVLLAVHGGAEYDGHLRQFGEPWPHLLIEQSFPGGLILRDYREVRFRLEFRIEKAEPAVQAPLDPSLHTAHITGFWTIHNMNPDSADYRDMIWFGIPLFDARHDIPPGHQALDIGKNDATGKFICTLEGGRFYSAPTGDGAWQALNRNLLPLVRDALAASQAKGFLTDSRFEDLAATSFNLGWEVPGPYDCAVRLRGLRLEGKEK